MSNMRFTYPKSTKTKAICVTAALCLVAIGAAAFFGIDRGLTPDTTAQNSSVASNPDHLLLDKDYGGMVEIESDYPTPPSSEEEVSSTPEATETVTQAAGFFVYPVTGEIIKNFSDSQLQYSLTYNDWRLHRAVDIKAPKGERINAAGDGTVIDIYEDRQYGKTIEINHGNDIVAIYSGLDEISVNLGDVVAVNMQIGTLGKVPCESVETTHLHFAIKKGDKYISPLDLIGV